MNQFIQSLVDAISSGAVYGLAALGIGLVFGVMRLANFAHGELITSSAYTLVLSWHLGPVIAIALSLVVPVALALLMEVSVFRHLRSANPATLLIASFGLSFLLQSVFQDLFGSSARSAPVATGLARSVSVLGLQLKLLSVVTIVLAAVLLLALQLFLTRTQVGLQVQAASADFRMARLLGVRANRVIMLTFALSGLLAAPVAFVQTVQGVQVINTFGAPVTILALIGAVIGGIDRLNGALLGGFIVGFVFSELRSYLPLNLTSLAEVFVFLLVILMLVVRPSGLLAAGGAVERT
jgi:branched-chain amino acid transport system permease protein